MVPAPGISPTQFAVRIKMKTLAKNQNVRLTRCEPIIPSRNEYRLSTSHSQKFWVPSGTAFMLRVASWAKTMSPTATIQLAIMEFVIGKPSGRAISTAFWVGPVSGCFGVTEAGSACARVRAESFEAVPSAAVEPRAWPIPRHANATTGSNHLSLLLNIVTRPAFHPVAALAPKLDSRLLIAHRSWLKHSRFQFRAVMAPLHFETKGSKEVNRTTTAIWQVTGDR